MGHGLGGRGIIYYCVVRGSSLNPPRGWSTIEKENDMVKPKHPKTAFFLCVVLFPVLIAAIIVAVIRAFIQAGKEMVDEFLDWI